MLYSATNDALKRLGKIAGYRYPLHYYFFRRWVANEANRKLKYDSTSSEAVWGTLNGEINLVT
jgi:Protein of unknown function (DUF3435)